MPTELENFISESENSQPSNPVDIWDSGRDEQSRLKAAVHFGQEKTPENAAKIIKIQSQTGLPQDFIDRNLESVEKEIKKQSFDPVQFSTTHPVTAGWMSESPNNAAAVRDDIESLSKLEDTVYDYGLGEMMWKSLNQGLSSTWANITRLPAFAYALASIPQNLFVKHIGRPDLQVSPPEFLLNNPAAKYYDRVAESWAPLELSQSAVESIKTGDFKQAGRITLAKIISNAPYQASMLAAGYLGKVLQYEKAAAVALGTGGAEQGAATLKQSQEEGKGDPSARALDAATQAVIESGFENIGTAGLFPKLVKSVERTFGKVASKEFAKGFALSLGETVAGESAEEVATSIAQDFSSYMTGVDPDAMKGSASRAFEAGLIAMGSSGMITSPAALSSGIIRSQETQRINKARDFYKNLGKAAEESVLKERLPQAQIEVVSRLTKDTPLENVYIPVAAMDKYFESQKVNPATLAQEMGLLKEYTEAKETGGDVKIPLSKWMEKTIGTDHYKGLADDVKFDPSEMTVNEHKQLQEELKKEAEAAAQQSPESQPSKEVDIQPDIAKFKAAGMDEQAATTAAQEMNFARSVQDAKPLFVDPKAIGMTEKQAKDYQTAMSEAKESAEAQLTARIMDQWDRQKKAWWNDELEKMTATVSKEISETRTYQALDFLQSAQNVGTPHGIKIKLDQYALEHQYPEFELKNLPKPQIYAKEGGMHPDEAAQIFGYRSGGELLFDLETAEKKEDVIKRTVDQRMKEKFGDIMTDGTMFTEALKSVHNEKRSELLQKELKYLMSDHIATFKNMVRRVSRSIPSTAQIRVQAADLIRGKAVREINPMAFQRAETRLSKEAVNFLLKGDIDSVFDAKLKEALNHELFRAASEARDKIDSGVNYVQKFNKDSTQEKLGKAGGDYLEQINTLLDRFDFRKSTSLKELDRRKSLIEWVKEQEQAEQTIDVPEKLLNEAYRTHYKDMAFGDFADTIDTIRRIEHQAILKNKLITSEKSRELERAQDEIVAEIGAYFNLKREPYDLNPDLKKRLFKFGSRVDAEHIRFESIFEFLGGNKPHGTVWEYFFKPIADSRNAKNDMVKMDAQTQKEIFREFSKKERAAWFTEKFIIPEASNDRVKGEFTKSQIIVAGLNWMNSYNREALLEGYGWTEAQGLAVLSKLSEKEWNMIQAIVDHIESYWPQIKQQEIDLNGVAPEKVEAAPFEIRTSDGKTVKMRGGYYPIIFDANQSYQQMKYEEAENVQQMFGGQFARAMTKHGHTKARSSTGGKPLELSFNGYSQHINAVIHDLAFRKAIIDVYKLANDAKIRYAIETSAGREIVKQLNPWLHDIANDRPHGHSSFLEGIVAKARMGATVVNLGLNPTSAVLQTFGYGISVKELGLKYSMKGLNMTYKNPKKFIETWEFIKERSTMMEHRPENFDRDLKDMVNKPGFGMRNAAWFMFVTYMDMSASIPTWIGAYHKALEGNVENIQKDDENAAIEYADSLVRTTQSSGNVEDLAAIQRGRELQKLFTMFYSSWSVLYNQYRKAGFEAVSDKNIPKLFGAMTLMWFAPAVLESVIRGQAPDDDESWIAWLIKNEFFYPFSAIIGVRDIAYSVEKAFKTGRKEYEGSPVVSAFEAGIGTLIGFKNLVNDDEVTRSNMKDAALTVGYFAQLPTKQIWKTSEYFYSWLTGEEQPDTLAEGVYRAIVTGKKR